MADFQSNGISPVEKMLLMIAVIDGASDLLVALMTDVGMQLTPGPLVAGMRRIALSTSRTVTGLKEKDVVTRRPEHLSLLICEMLNCVHSSSEAQDDDLSETRWSLKMFAIDLASLIVLPLCTMLVMPCCAERSVFTDTSLE